MTEFSREYDADDVNQRLAAAAEHSSRMTDLECIVVQYDDRPHRCTITPRECRGATRLTTWLSADIDAFVDLEQVR